ITFYEGKYFTGRQLEVGGDCDNFQDWGFMNRVNWMGVGSGAWICFDHPDSQGRQFVLECGECPHFSCWNGPNDHMDSCWPVEMHSDHYCLEIFEGCNFMGQSLEFTEDCLLLQGRGWTKTCIQAIVYGDGAWVLYEESNYRRHMYMVERGPYPSLNQWLAHEASIQALRW
uniref:Gamma-crystallin N n=1 Tax=Ornithorhynchus anatinus TaxID=9258 RepID=A0A6I8N7X1_ORNAN